MTRRIAALLAVCLLSAPAFAQDYYARERLSRSTAATPAPTPTPTPTPTPVTATCGSVLSGKWAFDYNNRQAVVIAPTMQTNYSNSQITTFCKNHVQTTGKSGVCAVNAAIYFYEGNLTLIDTFAQNKALVCTAN